MASNQNWSNNNNNGQRRGQNPDNRLSCMLSKEDNDVVVSLLGKRCFTLATGVAQLLTTDAPIHSKWVKRCTGVVCFVKDNPRRSYFIRLYDIDERKELVWQQELYTSFEFKAPRPYFVTFEAEESMAGLNFANETEANTFMSAISDKLKLRQQRIDRKRGQQNEQNQNYNHQPSPTYIPNAAPPAKAPSMFFSSNNEKKKNKRHKKDKKEKRYRKEDISNPTNFQHIQHIGWDPVTGFDMEKVGPEFKEFLVNAGVSESQLEDTETRKFIYDFIDQNGGIERALDELKRPPPPPPSVPPASTPRHQMIPTPSMSAPPNLRQPSKHSAAPPPPPVQPMPTSVPPPPPPPAGIPPPPPPPPPMPSNGTSMPPTAHVPVSMPNKQPTFDPRSALLDQIRQGAKLKTVEKDKDTESNKSDSTSNGEPRDALLQQIRRGVELKPVETNADRPASSGPSAGGLAAALQRALQERSKAIQQTDDEDDEEDEEDEWDD